MKSTLKSTLLVVLFIFSFCAKSEAQITSTGKTFYMSFMEMETRRWKWKPEVEDYQILYCCL